MRIIALISLLSPVPAIAETVFAVTTIRAQTTLTEAHLMVQDVEVTGAVSSLVDAIGKETRVTLYAGRPIRAMDIGAPALIDRNQIVPLIFRQSGLTITAEGRALGRAGAGEMIRVMNMASRATVSGRVQPDGHVLVTR
jgi:flagella basal body P-ring formation protein FlgA